MAAANVSQILADTLSADANTRIAAELKLSEVLLHQGCTRLSEAGLALAQLILAQDVDISLRQISSFSSCSNHSASIILRKYVKERWSPYFESFKGNAPSVEVKSRIRHAVLQGLSDSNRKIRSLCAHTMSYIGNCDWPDEYPELLNSLITLISSSSSDAVHGAMQVFTEFIKSDLTEDQILPVLRQLLPVLLTILGSTEQHTPLTRARTVSVFRQCVTALYMVKDQHPQAVKEATATILPVWLEAFKVLLNLDPLKDVSNQDNWDGLAVRIQVFKTLDVIHTSFPRAMTSYVRGYLDASLRHLQVMSEAYDTFYISGSGSAPGSSEEETVEIPHLICPLFDFVSNVVRGGKAKEWLQVENLNSLEETWATNANAFVAHEEDDTQAYGVRVAGFELLYTILNRSPAQICATFQTAIHQVIATSQRARENGSTAWWKPLEASFAAIGSQSEDVLECIENEQDSGRAKPIDVEDLLANVVPSVLNQSDFPFLQGRGFVFASQFVRLLPLQMAGQYLEAAMHVIESNSAGIPVKISAVKAIHNFCEGAEDSAITPFVSRIAQDLGPFLLVTTEDTLSLVLETMSVVLDVNRGQWLTTDLSNSLVLAVLEVWAKNNKDPIFLSIFTEIFTSLASSTGTGVYETVVKQALPTLCTAIAGSKPQEAWIAGSAIDLISSLVRGAPEGGLGDGFFALLAPSLFSCLSEAEDRDVLQNGMACLALIVRKDCRQILEWRDPSGQSGLDHILKVIAKLLQNDDESGGLVIGDLIIHLLRRAGEAVLPVLPELLQAMVLRMLSAKTATFIQSLVVPFAFLAYNQQDTVLYLLESTTTNGRNSLDILIQTWCENAETFQGFWQSRVSTLALTKLYASGRSSLQSLMVKGDIILKPETKNVIMTRSRTKTTPHEFTSVPFPVKALKLLVHDLRAGGDSATIPKAEFDVDSDDGDEEWTEEEQQNQGFKQEEFAFLSEMLGPRGVNFDNDDILEEMDDEDLRNDAISQIDMQAHLVSFFRECASHNVNNFSANIDQLSAEEIMVVRHAIDH
ncbi:armadillo-type protein [Suillus subaureus]|uniref:Armadillo-type protein n=1 Tax=Suillus subaureus TaxID=48587 RepID=A0A9P7E822_9AGAM|nr:armadillo-type protein [Suillus subaureus]KAG1813959.1 armadillo-type protein [Suillus subaureus]